jgi:hypothetical protein
LRREARHANPNQYEKEYQFEKRRRMAAGKKGRLEGKGTRTGRM